MSNGSGRRDVDIVLHSLLAFVLVAGDVFIVLFLVPMLFDQHSTGLDLASLALVVGAVAFSYLGGRYIWRSARHSIGGGEA